VKKEGGIGEKETERAEGRKGEMRGGRSQGSEYGVCFMGSSNRGTPWETVRNSFPLLQDSIKQSPCTASSGAEYGVYFMGSSHRGKA
jgi:hypothetical protein